MAGFSIVVLMLILTIVVFAIGVFVVFVLPLIASFIVIRKESERRTKKVLSLWGSMLGTQLLGTIIMVVLCLPVFLVVPFETWSHVGNEPFNITIQIVYTIVPIGILFFAFMFLFKKISKNIATKRTYIVFAIQSILMSFGLRTTGFFVAALLMKKI